jgi:subfamily B ATP-binding cassette protein MsbA
MKNLSRTLQYAKKYWQYVTLAIICASIFGIVSAMPSYLLKHTVDEVFIKRYSNLILPFMGAFGLFFILKALFMYLSSYFMYWVSNRVINDIRTDLYEKILNFPTSFYQKTTTGKLMSYFLNDIQMIQQASASAIRDGVRSFFEAIFLIGFAFYQDYQLGILLLLVGPVIGYTARSMGKKRKNASLAIQSQMGNVSSLLQESLIGIREIKAFNAEKTAHSRFKNFLDRCFGSIMHNVHIEALTPATIEVISMLGCSVIFYAAAHQVLDGVITAGQLTSFAASVILAYQPLKKMIAVYSDIQYGLAAADRVFEIMDTVYPATQNRYRELPKFEHAIQLEQVSFSYNTVIPDGYNANHNVMHHDNQKVLDTVTLTIKKGERIGIVGPSGSGKSTLCDLLLGFIVPTSGKILMDGIDITSLSFESLRSHIGYVGQRTFLFNDSILNNVAYSRPDATHDQVIAACKAAYADEFIQKLPNGYETIVGENGTLLSGGQKQRLTIARALLKDPEILIFDEATSSLDQESENMIRLAIEEIRKDKTLIVVSHRPTMLENLDRIFVVHDRKLEMLQSEGPKFSVKQNEAS